MKSAVWLAFAVLAAGPAIAADLQYDAPAARDAAVADQILIETQSCFYDAVRVQLQVGVRDSDKIIDATAPMCGRILYASMRNGGASEESAMQAVRSYAYMAIMHVPGVVWKTP